MQVASGPLTPDLAACDAAANMPRADGEWRHLLSLAQAENARLAAELAAKERAVRYGLGLADQTEKLIARLAEAEAEFAERTRERDAARALAGAWRTLAEAAAWPDDEVVSAFIGHVGQPSAMRMLPAVMDREPEAVREAARTVAAGESQ